MRIYPLALLIFLYAAFYFGTVNNSQPQLPRPIQVHDTIFIHDTILLPKG